MCVELAASSESLLLLAAAAESVAPLLRLLSQVTPLEDGGDEVHPLYQTGVWLLHCLQAVQLLAALQTAAADPAKQVGTRTEHLSHRPKQVTVRVRASLGCQLAFRKGVCGSGGGYVFWEWKGPYPACYTRLVGHIVMSYTFD